MSDPPTAIPYGHFVIRNFFFFDDHRGIYQSNWKYSSREDSYYGLQYKLQGFFGLNSFFDISLSPQFQCAYKGRYAYCNIGDLTVGLDFQLVEPDKFCFLPGIKFAIREVFPLGHYQLFNMKRNQMEKTGSGCYSTQFALFFYKGYDLSPDWCLNTMLELQYQINSPISVLGFHAYGGGFGTRGKLLVGNEWQSLLNLQFFYKAKAGCSLDLLYEHHDSSAFYGHPGLNFDAGRCRTNVSSFERVSLAPSFFYQFPSQIGFMLGSWISVCGRNSESFIQYVANVYYIF